MKIKIIGGGISGLSAAWYARKKFPDAHISLYEATDRLGGWMQTKDVNGFSFELGPRTFQAARCQFLLQMIQELGLEVIYSAPGTRYLWHRGDLKKMQSFWREMLWAGIRDLISNKKAPEDETIYDFACRRCGKQAAELFFDPMAKGIFGGDIHKLSVRSCFPFLFHSKSMFKAMGGQKDQRLFTVQGGMGQLISALAKIPDEIHLNCPAEKIEGDLTVIALPALQASRLTGIPLELRNESMTVVNLGYHGDCLPKQGYGYLVPSTEKESILGQIWDTSIFPISGQTKMTTMVRGVDPLALALDGMKRHLNINETPDAVFTTEAQIPQYDLYHFSRIATFESEVKEKFTGKVRLTGNYLEGASVEACLRRSSNAV